MSYGVLTEAEQAHWNEYTNLRSISDWPGFDAAQDQRRADSRTWILDRREYLIELAEGDVPGEPAGWDVNNRRERYDFLGTLNSGSPAHEVRLPCPGSATDGEKSYVEEREIWMWVDSTTDEQRERKQACTDWLVDRRKRLWHLMEDDPAGNEPNDRQARYDALCVATRHGQVYADWDAAHNKWGVPYSSSARAACKAWLDSYVGVHENPDGSNTGSPEPSGWQRRVYGDDGVPWCACFAVCSAWDSGVTGSGTAGVYNNTELAKRGEGIYRGYTTDPTQVRAGDHAFIGGDHTGVIYDPDTGETVEGNTSPSGGSQWDGGVVARKTRAWGYWTGFGLVRFPE